MLIHSCSQGGLESDSATIHPNQTHRTNPGTPRRRRQRGTFFTREVVFNERQFAGSQHVKRYRDCQENGSFLPKYSSLMNEHGVASSRTFHIVSSKSLMSFGTLLCSRYPVLSEWAWVRVWYGTYTLNWPAFSIKWPLKELYSIASHSPIHTHMYTPMVESTTQGDSQLVRGRQRGGALLRDTSTREEKPGIEPATFRLPSNPLCLLSQMPPPTTSGCICDSRR